MREASPRQEEARARAIARCRERRIIIPTLAQQRDPAAIDPRIRDALEAIDPQAVNPLNLFRITWHNDPDSGEFGDVDAIELPGALTGVRARIVGLVGRHFPTGSHKVGAAFGCLVPRMVSGAFDPTTQKAVWPSTGNYCRGGAFDSALLGCRAVAILPEEMSRERFTWLEGIGAEVIATPGCESNVKEIYDKCWEIRRTDPAAVIFNQFDQFGNYLWHFGVTGPAVEDVFRSRAGPRDRLAAWVGASGSSGTLGAGDYLKKRHRDCRIAVAEALQCPTLLMNGFGGHRIEGIGDKHVPWIHNVRNSDLVAAIDDEHPMRLLSLFNEPIGHDYLVSRGIPADLVARLPLLGISSIANLLAAIKTARYYEMDGRDIILIPFTDSADLYRTRIAEQSARHGAYTPVRAAIDFERRLLATTPDHLKELTHTDRKAIHNLKYFTWVEQQGRTAEELNALWSPDFWEERQAELDGWDEAIRAFNREVGLGVADVVGAT